MLRGGVLYKCGLIVVADVEVASPVMWTGKVIGLMMLPCTFTGEESVHPGSGVD